MDQIGYVHLKVEKNGKTFFFAMPMGAPLVDAVEVLHESLKVCEKMYSDALERAKEEEKKKLEQEEAAK